MCLFSLSVRELSLLVDSDAVEPISQSERAMSSLDMGDVLKTTLEDVEDYLIFPARFLLDNAGRESITVTAQQLDERIITCVTHHTK